MSHGHQRKEIRKKFRIPFLPPPCLASYIFVAAVVRRKDDSVVIATTFVRPR